MIVEINGVATWTAVEGDGAPVVLLHGGPGLPDYFDGLELEARVHRYEQRGCGRSADVGPYDVDTLVADLDALRAHWGLDRFWLAGHSWGASLGLAYALAHPDRLDGLLYLCGMGIEYGWEQEHARVIEERLGAPLMEKFREHQRTGDALKMLKIQLLTECHNPGNAVRLPAINSVRRDIYDALWSDFRKKTEQPGFVDHVRACHVRTLVMVGASDPRPAWPALKLARTLPNAHLEIVAGAGHFPWIEQPAQFAEIVAGFLA